MHQGFFGSLAAADREGCTPAIACADKEFVLWWWPAVVRLEHRDAELELASLAEVLPGRERQPPGACSAGRRQQGAPPAGAGHAAAGAPEVAQRRCGSDAREDSSAAAAASRAGGDKAVAPRQPLAQISVASPALAATRQQHAGVPEHAARPPR